MARNFFGFLAKNKPVWVSRKTKNIPGANWLRAISLLWTSQHDVAANWFYSTMQSLKSFIHKHIQAVHQFIRYFCFCFCFCFVLDATIFTSHSQGWWRKGCHTATTSWGAPGSTDPFKVVLWLWGLSVLFKWLLWYDNYMYMYFCELLLWQKEGITLIIEDI